MPSILNHEMNYWIMRPEVFKQVSRCGTIEASGPFGHHVDPNEVVVLTTGTITYKRRETPVWKYEHFDNDNWTMGPEPDCFKPIEEKI